MTPLMHSFIGSEQKPFLINPLSIFLTQSPNPGNIKHTESLDQQMLTGPSYLRVRYGLDITV